MQWSPESPYATDKHYFYISPHTIPIVVIKALFRLALFLSPAYSPLSILLAGLLYLFILLAAGLAVFLACMAGSW